MSDYVLAKYLDNTCRRVYQSRQNLYRGGLACAVGSQETKYLAVGNVKGYPVHGIDRAIYLAQFRDADTCSIHYFSSECRRLFTVYIRQMKQLLILLLTVLGEYALSLQCH